MKIILEKTFIKKLISTSLVRKDSNFNYIITIMNLSDEISPSSWLTVKPRAKCLSQLCMGVSLTKSFKVFNTLKFNFNLSSNKIPEK